MTDKTQAQNLEQLVLKLAEQNMIKYEKKDENDTKDIMEMGEKWGFEDSQQGRVEVFHGPGMGGMAGVRFRLNEDAWKAIEQHHKMQSKQFYEGKTKKTGTDQFKDASKKLQPVTLQSLTNDIIARNMVQYEESKGLYGEIEQAYTFDDPENHHMRVYHRTGMGGMPMVEFRLSEEATDKIKQLSETQRARFNAAMRANAEQKA